MYLPPWWILPGILGVTKSHKGKGMLPSDCKHNDQQDCSNQDSQQDTNDHGHDHTLVKEAKKQNENHLLCRCFSVYVFVCKLESAGIPRHKRRRFFWETFKVESPHWYTHREVWWMSSGVSSLANAELKMGKGPFWSEVEKMTQWGCLCSKLWPVKAYPECSSRVRQSTCCSCRWCTRFPGCGCIWQQLCHPVAGSPCSSEEQCQHSRFLEAQKKKCQLMCGETDGCPCTVSADGF